MSILYGIFTPMPSFGGGLKYEPIKVPLVTVSSSLLYDDDKLLCSIGYNISPGLCSSSIVKMSSILLHTQVFKLLQHGYWQSDQNDRFKSV